METALRYEINTNVSELKDKIYPTNAPEDHIGPYLVYTRISTQKIKTFEGYSSKQALSFMFSIMASKYADMVRIRKKVEQLLLGMVQRQIGNTSKFYVEDININNITEQFEYELKVNRGIIDFTIYFEEVK